MGKAQNHDVYEAQKKRANDKLLQLFFGKNPVFGGITNCDSVNWLWQEMCEIETQIELAKNDLKYEFGDVFDIDCAYEEKDYEAIHNRAEKLSKMLAYLKSQILADLIRKVDRISEVAKNHLEEREAILKQNED